MMEVRAVEQIVADVTSAMVTAGLAAATAMGAQPQASAPKNWFEDADAYAADVKARAQPLILESIADDSEEFDRLREMTDDLMTAGEFAMAVLDRALAYAGPIVLKMIGA